MAFDFGRGLSAMGEAVSKVAGDTLLDLQRADLQKQATILANDLATERESRGRAEAHGYDMEKQTSQQTFMAGENEKTRAAELQRTNISAEASKYSADKGFKARQLEIDAMAPVRQAQIEASQAQAEGSRLDNELKGNQAKARQELETATATGNQDAINKAKYKVAIYDEGAALRAAQARSLEVETQGKEIKAKADKLISDAKDDLLAAGDDPTKVADAKRRLAILESSTKEDRQEIALWQQQAKLAETAMSSTMTRITSLQNSGLLTSEGKELEQTLNKVMQQQQREFAAATRKAKALLDAVDPNSSRTTEEVPDLSKYMNSGAKPGTSPAKGSPQPNRPQKARPRVIGEEMPPGLVDSVTLGGP